MTDKKSQGKKSRVAGQRFEKRVREDLEKKEWKVDKWTNNVSDYPDSNINLPPEKRGDRKLIPAKPKFVFNPAMKRRIPMGMSSGFPDFIAFRRLITLPGMPFEIRGIESKMNGYIDKEEKAKCEWLLKNNIFSEILIASKGKKRGEIVYSEFPKI